MTLQHYPLLTSLKEYKNYLLISNNKYATIQSTWTKRTKKYQKQEKISYTKNYLKYINFSSSTYQKYTSTIQATNNMSKNACILATYRKT